MVKRFCNKTRATISFVKLPLELIRKTNQLQIGDVDGDGQVDITTSSQFSTTCGCSITTATTTDIDIGNSTTTSDTDSTYATITSSDTTTTTTSDIDTSSPTTTENNTTSTSQSDATITDVEPAVSCAEGESFTINSTVLQDLNGCYITTNTFKEGEIVYTESGNLNSGQNFVNADDIGDDSDEVSANPEDILIRATPRHAIQSFMETFCIVVVVNMFLGCARLCCAIYASNYRGKLT